MSELSFQEKLRNYARLGLIHGLGFDQKVRPFYIDSYQAEDYDGFLPILAEEAYKLGVETIDVRYRNPGLERAMFRGAPEEFRAYEPKWVSVRAQEIVDRDGARIALNGNGGLGVMDDVDSKYPSRYHSAYFTANEPYTSRRMKGLQPWTILDVPTVAWTRKLGMSFDDLWKVLFSVTGADREDSLEFARAINEGLHRRRRILDEMNISTLRFIGAGTDLKVGLSPKARWLGGSKQAEDGTWFEANWPSFEVYTTPDWRKTEGVVSITMPSSVYGPIVDGLQVVFFNGKVSSFSAEKGREAFDALIKIDGGADSLGEIALVGLDSPLAQYTEPHYCVMLDENKRCHMAFGQAYASCLEGGGMMSAEELAELGCNRSDIHHDVMISDDTTLVEAYDAGSAHLGNLLENGRWVGELL